MRYPFFNFSNLSHAWRVERKEMACSVTFNRDWVSSSSKTACNSWAEFHVSCHLRRNYRRCEQTKPVPARGCRHSVVAIGLHKHTTRFGCTFIQAEAKKQRSPPMLFPWRDYKNNIVRSFSQSPIMRTNKC